MAKDRIKELEGMVAWRDAQIVAARRQRDEKQATIDALLDILVRGGHITLDERTGTEG